MAKISITSVRRELDIRFPFEVPVVDAGPAIPGTPLITGSTSYLQPDRTFTRASPRTVTRSGALVELGPNAPAFDDQGLMLEGPSTNLFLNSLTPATQNITVTAATHTLSLMGTGSIALSGAAIATLVGLGPGIQASLVFTPGAGALTLTVSGSLTVAQLEVSPIATSFIVTGGAPATRLSDNLNWLLSDLGIPANGACTIGIKWRPKTLAAIAFPVSFFLTEGSFSDYLVAFTNNGTRQRTLRKDGGSGDIISNAVTYTDGQVLNEWVSFSGTRAAYSCNGSAVDSFAAHFNTAPVSLIIGAWPGFNNFLREPIISAVIVPGALTDAELETFSAL